MKKMKIGLTLFAGFIVLWAVMETGVRLYAELPIRTDFYGSISRTDVQTLQKTYGLKTLAGRGWLHLGWIADPERESYVVEMPSEDGWMPVADTAYGSFLARDPGRYRVWAVARGEDEGKRRLLGEAEMKRTPPGPAPSIFQPVIAGPWQKLFQPSRYGHYINDHDIYRDIHGKWRLVGITSRTDGDFAAETLFAYGVSDVFPPDGGMSELPPLADFGELAWAPEVLAPKETGAGYLMFWSPHRMPRMASADGITWADHRIVLDAPFHKFFRDPMILRVAEGQWLLYATARGTYFSQIDVYQSFDLTHWQYIRTALTSGLGSERNSPFASMESPSVVPYGGRFYLAFTYNNDSFFWPGVLLLFKIWPDRQSYNDTVVLHADNPYDFGVYRGRERTPHIAAHLLAHAPEFVYNDQTDRWFITTAGWPWAATLTAGEAAVAPLDWVPVP